MHCSIFFQQLRRGRRRTALYLLLLAAAAAFFVMSVNLYRNSVRNLAAVEDTYSTIAVMELYGDVDHLGELVGPYSEAHMGYRSVAVEGYDLSPIVTADGVTSWDLRSQYAACIEGAPAMADSEYLMQSQDVVRFRLTSASPLTIPISWDGSAVYDTPSVSVMAEVTASAAGCITYPAWLRFSYVSPLGGGDEARDYYREQVQALNRSDEVDTVTLYPGVEYIATADLSALWALDSRSGALALADQSGSSELGLLPTHSNYGYRDLRVGYGSSSEYPEFEFGPWAGQPFPLQRWEDVEADPALRDYFQGAWDSAYTTLCSYTVELTRDFTGIPVYHLGGASLKEGRLITQEEYASGAQVCLVSDQMAHYQGWQLGDALDMRFYEFDGMTNTNVEAFRSRPFWSCETEDFFDRGSYEIVGIYTQNPITGNSGIASSTLTMPWSTIYVPEGSVSAPRTAEELPVHGARLTIRLENGAIDRFLADIEAIGITKPRTGAYAPSFTFFDQGYSLVQPGLETMHGTAQLLLALSAVLLAAICVLTAYLFAHDQRQSVGILRMLGGSKKQALGAVLLCGLTVAAAGGLLGTAVGVALTDTVGASIVSKDLSQSQEAAALQAFVVDAGTGELALAARADLALTALAAALSIAAPVLLMLLFLLLYIHKEPRALLPNQKA